MIYVSEPFDIKAKAFIEKCYVLANINMGALDKVSKSFLLGVSVASLACVAGLVVYICILAANGGTAVQDGEPLKQVSLRMQ